MATGKIWNTAQISANGSTALWTPAAGKSWRLFGFHIYVPPNAILAARGILTINLLDGITNMNMTFDTYLGQTTPVETASTIQYDQLVIPWIDLGRGGMSSSAPNNILNVNLSSALQAGSIRVTVAGLEF